MVISVMVISVVEGAITMALRVISVLLTAFLATIIATPGNIAFGQIGPAIISTFVGSSLCHATETRGEQLTLCDLKSLPV